ncbi:MAG: sigma 54-interacting transcriptional regulator [Erysipelotrichaceae bacterium]|nr:sigma 54-interacting transcriptional regulator [Erysipelotrichaceae bacterium]
MAKTAVFLPGSIPKETVGNEIRKYPHIEPIFIEQISNNDVKTVAEQLIREKCDLFIARGLQAQMLSEITRIPVVPLRITAQELGILIKEVCEKLEKHDPSIALIGFSNMYCDVEHFEELFHVRLHRYLLNSMEEIDQILHDAVKDGMDAIIGGRHSCEKAKAFGLPAFFASGGTEGLSETLNMAEMICELTDTKRNDTAEITAMVENNFNGILQVGKTNLILRANRIMTNILSLDMQDIIGKRIQDLIPGISLRQLNDAIYDGRETFTSMILLNNVSYAVNISPVEVNGEIETAILTFQEGRRIRQLDQELRRDLLARGFVAARTFEKTEWMSLQMKDIRRTARQVAGFQVPVLITGERGVEKKMLAECIHNDSMVRDNSFIEVECASADPDIIRKFLFGESKDQEPSYAELAQDGTLYLKDVDALDKTGQYYLHQLIRGRRYIGTRGMYTSANVRVIASTERDLVDMVEHGLFRSDLYYEMSMVKLDIEPLRNRREDISMYVHSFMNESQKEYDRYIHLTKGAEEMLKGYDWPGNVQQVRSVCHKIVLLCQKRDADELFVRRQLDQSFPVLARNPEGEVITFREKKAIEITQLLQKHQGSREKVAQELGISKTTLWRYMKKYGINS